MSNIDWSRLITQEMKAAAIAANKLALSKLELASRNATAAAQIARIQDRVETLGYGIDSGEATEEDEAELAALTINLKAWKAYKYALGKVAVQAAWPSAPVWPSAPAIPDIAADPSEIAAEAI
ncbi:phage tail protein [Pseudomonas sp. Irchel 3A5]|uniref:phage tail protein n=1 Tax=Pseudomonas sp. Irchel 3A5 TaxID=2008911 RepID=UPI000BA3BB87|nr:phage tail protein [Pseudomonas sp. Irchel 3A5]